MIIKEPLVIDYENEPVDQLIERLEYAIEQHPSFLKVIPEEELAAYMADHKMRQFRVDDDDDEEHDDLDDLHETDDERDRSAD
jgi:hypothetical protein